MGSGGRTRDASPPPRGGVEAHSIGRPGYTVRPRRHHDAPGRKGAGMGWTRLMRAAVRGVGAALVGGLIGALLTRGLMRLIVVVADGDPSFTWTGLAFIALFYVVFLTPGAIALAWSRARW